MLLRRLLGPAVPLLLAASPLLVAPTASAATHPSGSVAPTAFDRHACTRTSSGSCIRGGQLCPKSKYHKSGWDAKGRRYVCKGSRTHPHWMKP
ncbi:hypothetical protein [Nocardioides sp. CER19]|uniref:hypothetical protein n=1 Tax=Nocardioides sp. CER19 TaxID=3038538 RepID=UPI00244B539A|nr:hypothetical protein [Nocardioides sp. CER19]MDH2413468.1 hypothetical protein [Nocardioides sp. CER19]